MRIWKLAVLAAMLAGCAQAAWASDADVVTQFGLLGVWAFDCSKPAAADNAYQNFAVAADGTVLRTLNMGDGNAFNGTTTMHGLNLVGADKMSGTFVRSVDGSTTTTTVLKSGNRTRGWDSMLSDGSIVIKGGVVVQSGRPTPWFEKCPAR